MDIMIITNIKELILSEDERNENSRIIVRLLVENNSRLKNGLRRTAMVRFYKDRNTSLPVTLYVKFSKIEEISIEPNSFKVITLESFKMNNFLEEERKLIESAFENEYSYILAVQDLSKKIWFSEGKALSYSVDIEEDKLEQETLKIVERKFK